MENDTIWGSTRIHGLLFFNIFLNDIFRFVENTKIANYAIDGTPYAIESSAEKLLEALENETSTLLKWFQWNEMKSNNNKCHLLVINHKRILSKLGIKKSQAVLVARSHNR